MAQAGYLAPNRKSRLEEKKGVEVGNIFQLGCHYSNRMKDTVYMSKQGKPKNLYMGCYGIGVGRTLATVVELHHDDKGIKWPFSIAPYTVHLINLGKSEEIYNQTESLYNSLNKNNIEVLWDDRKESPGIKFADADLIGNPIRIILSEKSIEKGGVEIKLRSEKSSEIIAIEGITDYVQNQINQHKLD
jgi:prolyl-tRNA synthetase